MWRPSPSFDERRPNFVVIHHTGDDSADDALRTLTDPLRAVSAHYLVARDGTIYQLLDERSRAWHAGKSRWGALTDLNSASLGVELDNNGDEPFPPDQIDALLRLLEDLSARYRIPRANFLGHADVSPGRKVDPSRSFPWRTLAERGFGLWCNAPLDRPATDFDWATGLRALGYDVANIEAATRAFKLHFGEDDGEPSPSERDQRVLWCLLRQATNSQ
jgi:N-acetylmuramoyl-L-alanine amidase